MNTNRNWKGLLPGGQLTQLFVQCVNFKHHGRIRTKISVALYTKSLLFLFSNLHAQAFDLMMCKKVNDQWFVLSILSLVHPMRKNRLFARRSAVE